MLKKLFRKLFDRFIDEELFIYHYENSLIVSLTDEKSPLIDSLTQYSIEEDHENFLCMAEAVKAIEYVYGDIDEY